MSWSITLGLVVVQDRFEAIAALEASLRRARGERRTVRRPLLGEPVDRKGRQSLQHILRASKRIAIPEEAILAPAGYKERTRVVQEKNPASW